MSRPTKRRKISPSDSDRSDAESFRSDSDAEVDDVEQIYALRRGKFKAQDNAQGKLPIRTDHGWVAQLVESAQQSEESDSFLGTGSEGSEADEDEDEEEAVPKKSQRQQINEAKEELARLASLINEEPEEHLGALRSMAQMSLSPISTITELALLSQFAVYKDIIPGYRIRPLTEDEKSGKISKDVRKLRDFEQSLVAAYQRYVRQLAELANKKKASSPPDVLRLANIAITCACNLLIAVPHFNFRSDVIKILVDMMSNKRVDDDYLKCQETLEKLFAEDEDGNASLDAVTQLTKMIKASRFNVAENVLNTFLHLRLLTEFNSKASRSKVDPSSQDEPLLNGKKQRQQGKKKPFINKKQKKIMRENKKISKEMAEADATVSHEERDTKQAETLKLVFVTYFRILKNRTPRLMGAVLEGLAKYAHLINQDFFGDLLEALRELVQQVEAPPTTNGNEPETSEDNHDEDLTDTPSSSNATRQSLLCVVTAFALLSGQETSTAARSSSLQLDLSFFISHLYRNMHSLALNPDIEFSHKSLHLPDPDRPSSNSLTPAGHISSRVNAKTTSTLLLRALTHALIPPLHPHSTPRTRLLAFTKQLYTACLHAPEKTCIAILRLVREIIRVHGGGRADVASLWHADERSGDGTWNGNAAEVSVESSNPAAAVCWEGELLRMHFAPGVREGVKDVERAVAGCRK